MIIFYKSNPSNAVLAAVVSIILGIRSSQDGLKLNELINGLQDIVLYLIVAIHTGTSWPIVALGLQYIGVQLRILNNYRNNSVMRFPEPILDAVIAISGQVLLLALYVDMSWDDAIVKFAINLFAAKAIAHLYDTYAGLKMLVS
jgi:hypothetical protein